MTTIVKGDLMPRIRRTPEAARAHILAAARRLLIGEGPRSLKLQRVGKAAGMSHASVVHYFGTIDGLTLEMVKDNHRKRREALRAELGQIETKQGRQTRIEQALANLSDREQGRLTIGLLSLGLDPFPPAEELGLASIVDLLCDLSGISKEEAQRLVLVSVFTMLGEAMVGVQMRERMGVDDDDASRTELRRWLLTKLA
jgi:AcrR family transcriptional regulator